MVRNPLATAGDVGSIPGLGRSPGGGNGNPLQYSCLEISTDRGAQRAHTLQLAGWSGISHSHGLGHVLRANVEVSFQTPVQASPS